MCEKSEDYRPDNMFLGVSGPWSVSGGDVLIHTNLLWATGEKVHDP